jgi:hypothetical protein
VFRTFTLAIALILLSVGTAAASKPTHVRVTTTGTFDAAAGTLCDFDYHQEFTVVENAIVFGDPADPTRVIDHLTEYVTHTNVATGYTLHEVDHVTATTDLVAGVQRQTGNFWHLRDASGHVVVVQSGQLVFDTATGLLLKRTPNIDPSFAGVICAALGGAPSP